MLVSRHVLPCEIHRTIGSGCPEISRGLRSVPSSRRITLVIADELNGFTRSVNDQRCDQDACQWQRRDRKGATIRTPTHGDADDGFPEMLFVPGSPSSRLPPKIGRASCSVIWAWCTAGERLKGCI